MINRNQKRKTVPSFVPKFSDPDIILGVLNSYIWKHLFLGEKRALWIFVKAIIALKVEMFISPLRAFLRYGHGKRTTDITVVVMATLMMIAFNTKALVGYLATFFPLAAPFVPFTVPADQLLILAFVDIRSPALLYFWIGYLTVSIFHLIMIYKGWGNTQFPSKRGTPILYTIIFKYLRVPEAIVQRFIEPILVSIAGYVLISTEADFTFGLFLIIAAICLFLQEIYDAVVKFSISQ